jgi:hypothetical protein
MGKGTEKHHGETKALAATRKVMSGSKLLDNANDVMKGEEMPPPCEMGSQTIHTRRQRPMMK